MKGFARLLPVQFFFAVGSNAFVPFPRPSVVAKSGNQIKAGVQDDVVVNQIKAGMNSFEDDVVVNLIPKFKIKEGMREEYMANVPKFAELVVANEQDACVHYGFVGPTEDGYIICREGYDNAEGVLAHLDNVGAVLDEALKYSDVVEVMVQGPEAELEKLKEPLADFNADYYPLAPGAVRRKQETSNYSFEDDIVVNLIPKFKIKEGMREEYMANVPKFAELVVANEQDACVHYGFVGPTEDGYIICREGYDNAEGVLAHLDNVGAVLDEALKYSDVVEVMVQGPEAELEKLKEPLADFNADYYPLAPGAVRRKSS